ncbi:hypothetical protein BDZ45DRAFT_742622 [Acephala macrosclerotiorum]|nr:hypothetical protein BDZ45DRAFT_742622 [Acephala macrosclerotiorum]
MNFYADWFNQPQALSYDQSLLIQAHHSDKNGLKSKISLFRIAKRRDTTSPSSTKRSSPCSNRANTSIHHPAAVTLAHQNQADDPAVQPRDRLAQYESKAQSSFVIWGKPELAEEISVNGAAVSIMENLFTALQHLQDENTLWVDAIRINQSEDAEKSAGPANAEDL